MHTRSKLAGRAKSSSLVETLPLYVCLILDLQQRFHFYGVERRCGKPKVIGKRGLGLEELKEKVTFENTHPPTSFSSHKLLND